MTILTACKIMQAELQHYGIDWDGPSAVDNDHTVEVPAVSCPLHQVLQSSINPLDECDDLGVSMYAATRAFVEYCIDGI